MSVRERCAAIVEETSEIYIEPRDETVAIDDVAMDEAAGAAATTELAGEIDRGNDDVRRLEDTAAALEDMTVVEEHIVEARPTDLVLIETAARLATAGSDVTVEEVIPALESYRGKAISMEGIRSVIAGIWNSIVAMLKKLWERIEAFFSAFVSGTAGVARTVATYKKKLAGMGSAHSESAMVTLGAEASVLMQYGKTPSSGKSIIDGLRLTAGVVAYAFGSNGYAERVANSYKAMASEVTKFRESDAVASLDGVCNMFAGDKIFAVPGAVGSDSCSHPSFDRLTYSQSHHLPGEWVWIWPSEVPGLNGSSLEKAGEIQQSIVAFTRLPVSDYKGSADMRTMSQKELGETLDWVDAIIRDSHRYVTAGKNQMSAARAQLQGATDKLTKSVKETPTNGEAMRHIRAVMRFNSYMTALATKPTTSLLSTSVTICRNALIVTRRNMAVYR